MGLGANPAFGQKEIRLFYKWTGPLERHSARTERLLIEAGFPRSWAQEKTCKQGPILYLWAVPMSRSTLISMFAFTRLGPGHG